MIKGGSSQNTATRTMQTRLAKRLARAKFLNVQMAAAKCELMHLIKGSLQEVKTQDPIRLYGTEITPKQHIRSLSVWIDHQLSFRHHASAVCSVAARGTGMLCRITKRKGSSPGALHHHATTTTIPAILWGAKA